MTIKELYEYALEHDYEEFEIMIEVRDVLEIVDYIDADKKHKMVILY